MSNFIEEGGRIVELEKEMQVFYTGIFYSAKDLLEKQGLLVKNFPLFRHRVFNHIAHFRRQEVLVKISAGADLENARKMSVSIQGIGLLEVRKKGSRGEEEFKGTYYRENSGWEIDLNINSFPLYPNVVPGFFEAIMQVRSEIIPH